MGADLIGLVVNGVAGHAFLEDLFSLGGVAFGLSGSGRKQKNRDGQTTMLETALYVVIGHVPLL
jgi:hypothetical protein